MAMARKSQVLRAIPLLITVCLLSFPAQAQYSGGTGEHDDPYQIATAEDLMLLGDSPEDSDEHFILTADIDLDPNLPGCKVFTKALIDYFNGIFEGNGYTISNLTITGDRYLGLFGRLGTEAMIFNLGLIAADINGTGGYIGSLAGWNEGGTITKSCSTGMVSGYSSIGGLVGENEGIITNCYSRGTVSGTSVVGGLVGRNVNVVSNCYSTGSVSPVILSNYEFPAGGLIGKNYYSTRIYVINGTVTQSFWDTETSGQSASDGGTGLNTAQMQTIGTFLDAGWNFVGEMENGTEYTWWIHEGLDYPKLWWEIPTKYGGGKGGRNIPYLIYTAEHLNAVSTEPNDWDKHFKLMADIDLSEYSYDAALIAPDVDPCDLSFNGTSFKGIFDGSGHTISNMTITGESYLGLFGQLETGAEIKNLGVVDVNITGSDYVGGFVGYSKGNISTSYCTGKINGDKRVGGLTGRNWHNITECFSKVTVTGNDDVGGISGGNYGSITNSYSTGAVTSIWDTGGIVGDNYGIIDTCYSTSAVSGTNRAGGLVGNNWPDTGIVSGFWDMETSGQSTSDGGTGKTTDKMQTASPFLEAGWDFVDETTNGTENIWWILEGQDYPRLWWDITQTKYSGGSGKSENPYQIVTAEDLMLLGESLEDYNKHFILTADIDLDPNLPGRKVFDKAIISPDNNTDYGFQGRPFGGVLDGNGHTVSHLTIIGDSYLGLFGRLGPVGKIKDLAVVDVNIMPDVNIPGGDFSYIGGLIGYNRGSIIRCYSSGVISNANMVGGLVGENVGNLINCSSVCSVTGVYMVGGLAGDSRDSNIKNCYSNSVVTGSYYAGGLVGNHIGNIIYCFSTGEVIGREAVGGLVGQNGIQGVKPYPGYIDKSYSLAGVRGEMYVGGLVGDNRIGAVTQCYSAGSVSGDESVGGLVGLSNWVGVSCSVWDVESSGLSESAGGLGLTTHEMMDPYTLGLNGFADDPNWVLDPGRDYPRLAWEGMPGRIIPEPEIKFLTGQGTSEAPYKIDTFDQLIFLGKGPFLWDKHYVLGADIDLDPDLPGRIIFRQAPIQVFKGVFDGNSHTISHMTIKGESYLGLFGLLGPGAEVKNLGVVNVNITGSGNSIGGLAGTNEECPVNCCYSTGTVSGNGNVGGLIGSNYGAVTRCYSASAVSGDSRVGGLMGFSSGDLTKCYSTGAVNGGSQVGGLVGFDHYGIVNQCFSTGTVSSDGNDVGGLVGRDQIGEINQCYSIGSVGGGVDNVGGLVGYDLGGIATQCYSTGAVRSGADHVGGLVGGAWSLDMSASFWDTQTSGQAASAGGTGKTTAEMQTASTFLDAGWDFVDESANGTEDIWWIDEGRDYPRLWWEAE